MSYSEQLYGGGNSRFTVEDYTGTNGAVRYSDPSMDPHRPQHNYRAEFDAPQRTQNDYRADFGAPQTRRSSSGSASGRSGTAGSRPTGGGNVPRSRSGAAGTARRPASGSRPGGPRPPQGKKRRPSKKRRRREMRNRLITVGCVLLIILVLFCCRKNARRIDIGGKKVDPETTELSLTSSQYDIDTLTSSLTSLPELQSITLTDPDATGEQLAALQSACSGIDLSWTVTVLGESYDWTADKIDISSATSDDISTIADELDRLPNLNYIELMGSDGSCNLTVADVKTLEDSVPDAAVNYTFDFYGQTLSTTDTEVEYDGVDMGSGAVDQLREVLSIMQDCTRFVVADCGIDSETLAGLRDEFPDTKVVWRVYYGEDDHCLTDETSIVCTNELEDSNSSELKWCNEVKYMDIGHNESMKDVSFLANMKDMEILILSGSSITDISSLADHDKLYFLELTFCGWLSDMSVLDSCPSLAYLNASDTQVSDLSCLDDKPMERLMMMHTSTLSADEMNRFVSLHPDCWTTFYPASDGDAEYGYGWRYEDHGYTFSDCYLKVRDVFDYDDAYRSHDMPLEKTDS